MEKRALSLTLPVYLATFAAALAWSAAVVLAPYLASRDGRLAGLLYACFAPVCHQLPERSFFAFGHPLAVCARCAGIYAGAVAGLALYPALRGFHNVRLPRIGPFLAATMALAVDAGGGLLGLWDSPAWLRFAVGLPWGMSLPYFFITGIVDLLASRAGDSRPPDPVRLQSARKYP